MKMKGQTVKCVLASVCTLVIILDGKTAVSGMQEGILLCIRTVIPALFPFFILSGLINSSLLGQTVGLFHHLGRLCKIPKGGESILLVGFLSGYPLGAQLITQAYTEGSLSTHSARRMLGFCSNAGPAFIFGMLSCQFESPAIGWVLWAIHIASALIVGGLLPGKEQEECVIKKVKPVAVTTAMQNALKNMAAVCGWVVIFRVVLSFCSRWFLWLLPKEIQVLICGMMELSNGCVLLRQVETEGLRFVFAGLMLSFGGLCVMMQTKSVTQKLGLGYYFPGKILQALIAGTICALLQPVIFDYKKVFHFPLAVLVIMCATTTSLLYFLHRKKVVAFRGEMMYNIGS